MDIPIAAIAREGRRGLMFGSRKRFARLPEAEGQCPIGIPRVGMAAVYISVELDVHLTRGPPVFPFVCKKYAYLCVSFRFRIHLSVAPRNSRKKPS